MKRAGMGLMAAIALAAALALGGAPPPTQAAGQAVGMGDNFFGPDTITVTVGDTVTWTNNGVVPHTATDQGVFDSGILMGGESFSYTFSSTGTYDYICLVHPDVMRATIVVQDAAPPAPDDNSDQPAQPESQPVQPAAPAAPAAGEVPSAGFGPDVVNAGGGGWAIAAGAALLALGALGAGVATIRSRKP